MKPPGVPNPFPAASAADKPNGSDKPAAAQTMRIHLFISMTSNPIVTPHPITKAVKQGQIGNGNPPVHSRLHDSCEVLPAGHTIYGAMLI